MRRIFVLLKDNMFVQEMNHTGPKSEVKLMTDEQVEADHKLRIPGNPWRWHLMDTRAFEMINPPTEEVVVMKDPAAKAAKAGDLRERIFAHVQSGARCTAHAFDTEERRWVVCTLKKGKDEHTLRVHDVEDFEWDVTASDVLDPKQFKNFKMHPFA